MYTVNSVDIAMLEKHYEDKDYIFVVQNFEKTGLVKQGGSISEEDVLNFYDMVLISHSELYEYDKALDLISEQISRTSYNHHPALEYTDERLRFYCTMIAEIFYKRERPFYEYLALKFFIKFGGTEPKWADRYLTALNGLVKKTIIIVWVVLIFCALELYIFKYERLLFMILGFISGVIFFISLVDRRFLVSVISFLSDQLAKMFIKPPLKLIIREYFLYKKFNRV